MTGQKPFQAENYDELLEQVLWEDPTPIRQCNDAIPEELDRICLKALSKRAADRYPSMAAFVDDLRHALEAASDGVTQPQATDDTSSASVVSSINRA